MRARPGPRSGFTLAEAAVTIALVAVTLTVLLQALEGSKLQAANTRDQKIARELALDTLSRIEAGMWQEELDFVRSGDYAEEGHPNFWFELAVGDEAFRDADYGDPDAPFDNWAHREELEREREFEADRNEDEDEEPTEPFEKVRIRVTFPEYGDLKSELTLERWIPWIQVYGEDEEQEDDGQGETGTPNEGSGGAGGRGGSGG